MQKIIWLNHRDIRHQKAGGAERTIYEISQRLIERGYEVDWLSVKAHSLPVFEQIGGVNVYRMGGNFTSHISNIIYEWKTYKGAVTIDDMAHVVPWLSERLTLLPGTVFFRHLHRRTIDGQLTPTKATLMKIMESNYCRLYKKWPFVTESKQGVRDLENLGIQKSRIIRIPPGVEPNLSDFESKSANPSLVYFGGMRDYKRPCEAIYLLDKLRQVYPNVKLRITGYGPSLSKMVSLARKLKLEKNIEFLGKLDRKDLFKVVSQSWLNLHFSMAEGWGLSILEASACGTPTVAYEVPGVSEVISNGENGLTSTDGDRDSLLVNAITILNSYDKWINSSRKVSDRYSWDKTTDMWEKHLNSLI